MLPFRRSFSLADWMTDEMIRVDEYQENGTLVIRGELAGIDPDKDVTVTVSEGMLRIHAERREASDGADRPAVSGYWPTET
jgi:HSP20 family protein